MPVDLGARHDAAPMPAGSPPDREPAARGRRCAGHQDSAATRRPDVRLGLRGRRPSAFAAESRCVAHVSAGRGPPAGRVSGRQAPAHSVQAPCRFRRSTTSESTASTPWPSTNSINGFISASRRPSSGRRASCDNARTAWAKTSRSPCALPRRPATVCSMRTSATMAGAGALQAHRRQPDAAVAHHIGPDAAGLTPHMGSRRGAGAASCSRAHRWSPGCRRA